MRISSVRGTYCFVARGDQLAQVVRVVVADAPSAAEAEVALSGDGLAWTEPWRGALAPERAGSAGGPAWAPGRDAGLAAPARFTSQPDLPDGVVVEVPVIFDAKLAPGRVVTLKAVARSGGPQAEAEAEGDVVVREPGWRMLMVPHFHYDPVWWNTQAAYTSGWDELVWPRTGGRPSSTAAWPWSRPTWNGHASTLPTRSSSPRSITSSLSGTSTPTAARSSGT